MSTLNGFSHVFSRFECVDITKRLANYFDFVKFFTMLRVTDESILLASLITLLKKLYNFIIYVKIMATK